MEHHDDRPVANKKEPVQIRKSVNIIGKDIYNMYLQLAYADIQGKSQYGREKGMGAYIYSKEQYEYIVENNICTCKGDMAVSGRDLIAAGCPTGEIIGNILDELLKRVIQKPQLNNKESLMEIAKTMF